MLLTLILYCAINGSEYDKISCCDNAKEMWDKLQVTHEGIDKVKETKMNMLVYELELFHMNEGVNIEDIFRCFAKIVGDLKSLGRNYSQYEQAVRILKCLLVAWQSKVDSIESNNNIKVLTYDELRGMLIAYKSIYMKIHELEEKRNNLAFTFGLNRVNESNKTKNKQSVHENKSSK